MALHVLVLAGGSGTRLWPLSRASLPKHLLDIGPGGVSLLRATVTRALGLTASVHVVTTADQEPACRRALEGLTAGEISIIAEPCARGTGPALGLATGWIARGDPEAVICSVHADHHVGDDDAYRAAVYAAAGWAAVGRCMTTVGVRPTYAATGFGYIEMGAEQPASGWRPLAGSAPADPIAAAAAALPAHQVLRFIEKPSHDLAQRYVGDNQHLWNLGLFAWPADAFLAELGRADPDLAGTLREVIEARAAGDEASVAARYGGLKGIAVEPLLLERTAALTVVRASFPWSDLGSWPDIHAARLATGEGDVMGNIIEGDGAALASRNCLVSSRGGRFVAVVGGEGLIVVDTGDAVLVAPAGQAQRVRQMVELLAATGRAELT